MIQMSFTAQELYCMAYLQRKAKMYGIPNLMAQNPEKKFQEIIGRLLAKKIVRMDMDGLVYLEKDYHDLVSVYCDCNKCLTVNQQGQDQGAVSMIFWQYGDGVMMAEAVDDRYVFSAVDHAFVRTTLDKMLYGGSCRDSAAEAVIPQLQLTKAKRLCAEGKPDDAALLLRQNGAADDLAEVIVDGLQEKAWYLAVLLMDVKQDACEKTEVQYLASREYLLKLGEAVVNLRSCTRFAPCNTLFLQQTVSDFAQRFLEEGTAK